MTLDSRSRGDDGCWLGTHLAPGHLQTFMGVRAHNVYLHLPWCPTKDYEMFLEIVSSTELYKWTYWKLIFFGWHLQLYSQHHVVKVYLTEFKDWLKIITIWKWQLYRHHLHLCLKSIMFHLWSGLIESKFIIGPRNLIHVCRLSYSPIISFLSNEFSYLCTLYPWNVFRRK